MTITKRRAELRFGRNSRAPLAPGKVDQSYAPMELTKRPPFLPQLFLVMIGLA